MCRGLSKDLTFDSSIIYVTAIVMVYSISLSSLRYFSGFSVINTGTPDLGMKLSIEFLIHELFFVHAAPGSSQLAVISMIRVVCLVVPRKLA